MTETEQLKRAALTRIGTVVKDKWSLLRLLGIGGSAAVYEAEHRNGRRVAIKMLHGKYAAQPSAQRRFLQEAYAANRVQHPDVVQVYDDGVDENGNVFLVGELLQGRSLAELQSEHGAPLPPATAVKLVCAALKPLAAAHATGVVHRDLKPGNVFLCDNGAVKLLDFGIARIAEAPPGGSMQTATGAWLGTPAFVAPEQARAHWSEVDERSDVWAMGATLFTLVTGQFVYQGQTVNEQLGLAMTTPARSLASVGDFPAPLVRVVDRALSFEQAERFPDAAAMLEALSPLRDALNDDPISVQTLASLGRERPKGSRNVALLGLALGTLLGLAVYFATRSPTAETPRASVAPSALLEPTAVPAPATPAPGLAPAPEPAEVAMPSASAVAPLPAPRRTQPAAGKARQAPSKSPATAPLNPLDIRD